MDAWLRATSGLKTEGCLGQVANVTAIARLDFTDEELGEIDRYATDADINIWAQSSE